MPARSSTRWDGGTYQATRRKWKILVEQGGVCCWRCHRPIVAGKIRQPDGRGGTRLVDGWHLGHSDTDRSIIMGPEHALCNLRGAAAKSNRSPKRAARRRARAFAPLLASRRW